ncbi:MAG: hypothetical protein DI611_12410 [Brachybacterium faecium]|nr:MAG: hypothetical protein DI611_12410 [Brachybacterium faecium]
MPSAARHAAPTQRTALRRVLGTVSLTERLLLAALAMVLLWVGLTSVGGTYAMWADEATVEGTALTTGTAELSARWASRTPESVWQNLLPGESASRELTLENTGAVPLEVTMSLDAEARGLELLPTHAPIVIEPDQSLPVTVELTATEGLRPGDEISVEILLEGTQIR